MFKTPVIVLVISVVIGLGALFAAFSISNSQNDSKRATCIAEHKDTQTLNNLLIYIEGRSLQNPQLTQQQRQAVTIFYANLLKTLPSTANPC